MSLSSGIQAVGASQRMRRNLLRRQFLEEWNKSKSRVVAIGLGGSFIFGGLFIAALFVGHFLASAGFSRIYPSFFMLLLLGSGGGLFISSMGQAANSFFAADDAWFWDAAPAPLWARFIDSLMRTGRTALPSMLAMTGAMGVGLFAGAGFDVVMLLRIATALFLHAVFILLLAVGCVQLLAALLPAGQIRRLSLVGLGGLLVAALMAVRSSGLFIGLSGKVSAETLDHFSAMSNVGPSWFWTQGLLRFAIEGRVTSFFLLWIFGLSIFSYFCFHFFYSVARDKAADAGEKSAQAGIAFFFMRQVTTLISAGTSKKMRALIQKDVRVFFRDPAQWSQSALLVGIGILYGVNVDMLEHSFRRLPEWGPVLTMGFHVGACSFVAAGLSARFSFSQVALEAESFWMVEQGPLSSTEMLQAKVRSSALLVVGFPILLCAFASLFMPFSVFQRIASVTIVTFTAWQLVKQAVGMGAIGPRFDAATVMEATMGAAALSTMAWGISMAFWSTTWAVTSLLLSKTFGLGNSVFALCALPWAAGLWWRGKRSQRKGVDALEHRRLFPQAV